MKIIWYGTATVLLQGEHTSLLFDPYYRTYSRLQKNTVYEFMKKDAVFLTHGHFDHMSDVPHLMSVDKATNVYCTKTPRQSLLNLGADYRRVHKIEPGQKLQIGDASVTVFQGRHLTFDPMYIMKIIPRCAVMLPTGFRYWEQSTKMHEAGETVGYLVEMDGKRVFVMGSFGTAENTVYPENVDAFVLPVGAAHNVMNLAKSLMQRLNPKMVMVSHFDNAFPPLTLFINCEKYRSFMNENFPDTRYIVPVEREAYEI